MVDDDGQPFGTTKIAIQAISKAISRAQAEGEAAPTGPYVVEFNEETQGYNVCERGGGPIVAVINALDYEISQQRAIADLFAAVPTMRAALERAAKRFRQYERMHAKKQTIEGDLKARANAIEAEACEAAQTSTGGAET